MAVYIFKQTHTSPELIALSEAKKQLKIEADWVDEDSLITGYINAAIATAENYIGRSINEAKFKITTSAFVNNLQIKRGPISAIDSIKYFDEAGDEQTLPSEEDLYELRPLDEYQDELFYEDFEDLPTVQDGKSNAVTINITTGYASGEALPADIRSAIYLLIGTFYENRQDSVENLPKASSVLLNPYRYY